MSLVVVASYPCSAKSRVATWMSCSRRCGAFSRGMRTSLWLLINFWNPRARAPGLKAVNRPRSRARLADEQAEQEAHERDAHADGRDHHEAEARLLGGTGDHRHDARPRVEHAGE